MSAENELIERLMNTMTSHFGMDRISGIKERLIPILYEYNIEKKANEIIPYEQTKNEVFLKRFAMNKMSAGCAQRTITYYINTMEAFFKFIQKDLDQITSFDVQYYLAKRMQKVSLVTTNNEKRVLSSFYNFMFQEELVPKNPMNKVDRIRTPKRQKKAFDDYEVEKIRAACRDSRETAMVEFLLSTGCRVSEVVGTRISDIDGDMIQIIGKGNKQRTVYLTAKAKLAIDKYLEDRKDKSDWLFASSISAKDNWGIRKYRNEWYKYPELVRDEHLDVSTFENVIRKTGKRAGVENVHPHRFRRTCATHALKHGMPVEIVSRMLGHSSLDITNVYLDIQDDDIKMAHKKYIL